VGNWVGGQMPTWLGNLQQVSATSTRAYGASLLIIAICTGLGIIPLLLMRMPKVNTQQPIGIRPLLAFLPFRAPPGG